jgi:hypothetical protein
VESHRHGDYCTECARFFILSYIDKMHGTEELELENSYLLSNEAYENYEIYDDDYELVENDRE